MTNYITLLCKYLDVQLNILNYVNNKIHKKEDEVRIAHISNIVTRSIVNEEKKR